MHGRSSGKVFGVLKCSTLKVFESFYSQNLVAITVLGTGLQGKKGKKGKEVCALMGMLGL